VEVMCEEFLEWVWGEEKGWIDLPAKVGQYWVPFHAEWPEDEAAITRRIDSSIRDRENLYYSVALFRNRGRKIEDVLPTAWLWADLDTVHPSVAAGMGWMPTIAVESSPGRYQALWELENKVRPKDLERLNRAMTYALDADKGGWDLTQVLRLPGTRNWKYGDAPTVEVMWYQEDKIYSALELWKELEQAVGAEELEGALEIQLPKRAIPGEAKRLLRTPVDQVQEGKRSDVLWRLECLLAESGLKEGEIFGLVWPCAWNKWAGVGTGKSRLRREIRKAMQHVRYRSKISDAETVADDSRASAAVARRPEGLPWVAHDTLVSMNIKRPRWMIEDVWGAVSAGLVAGEPKTGKSLVALAMGVAVASGEPFLGRFRTKVQGPVLMVDNETGLATTQDRLRRMERYMGLIGDGAVESGPDGFSIKFPEDSGIPMKFLCDSAFDLTNEDHLKDLVREIEELEPVLVILDPLYLMLGGIDENRVVELRPTLQWLSQLRNEAGCSIAVVHHMRKQRDKESGTRPGQRVSGSWALHGWPSSSIYSEQKTSTELGDGWSRIRISTEHRSASPRRPFELAWTMEEDDGFGMSWEVDYIESREKIQKDRTEFVEGLVKEAKKITFTDLEAKTELGRQALKRHLNGFDTIEVKRDHSAAYSPLTAFYVGNHDG
jgi:hypothetical protein